MDYSKLLSGQYMDIENLVYTPEKTRVSIRGIVTEVSSQKIAYMKIVVVITLH